MARSLLTPPPFSTATADKEQAISTFWLDVHQGKLTTTDQITLAYCSAIHPNPAQAIVLSSGRIESYLKYQELIFDLFNLGYSVYALDHRGQGLSSRLTANPHQGHVENFSDYIDDFKLFIESVVKTGAHKKHYLVGHSMGGAIATLYLQQAAGLFNAAVFSAPMYGIHLPLPKGCIRWLCKWLDNGSPSHPNYVLGGKDYVATQFEHNQLTHSRRRYQNFQHLYATQPTLQLGSPTNRWLKEAINACEQALVAAKHSTTPILILQAAQDAIVDNQALASATGEHCHCLNIANARHEIFMEQDAIREQALTALVDFFHSHP